MTTSAVHARPLARLAWTASRPAPRDAIRGERQSHRPALGQDPPASSDEPPRTSPRHQANPHVVRDACASAASRRSSPTTESRAGACDRLCYSPPGGSSPPARPDVLPRADRASVRDHGHSATELPTRPAPAEANGEGGEPASGPLRATSQRTIDHRHVESQTRDTWLQRAACEAGEISGR